MTAQPAEARQRTGAHTLFLDRDGVINRKLPEGRYVRAWEEFEFLPGVLGALADAAAAGMRTVVVTNQRGIAKGLMTEHDLHEIHRRMHDEILRAGGRLAGIYYCPHNDGCECRKPRPGMLRQAAAELGLDVANATLVGDRVADMQAGRAVGAAVVLVRSEGSEPEAARIADHVAVDLEDAIRWVKQRISATVARGCGRFATPGPSGRHRVETTVSALSGGLSGLSYGR